MCMKCVYSALEQLRWELVLQECELSGQKPSPEVLDTVKDRVQGNNVLLPRIRLERPEGMDDQHYNEATGIFKDVMLQKRRQQIAALQIVADLLEGECIFKSDSVVSVNAGHVLNGGEEEGDVPGS